MGGAFAWLINFEEKGTGNFEGIEMGKSDIVEKSLLHGEDIESHGNARMSRDYIAIPGPAAESGSAEPDSLDEGASSGYAAGRPGRRTRNVFLLVSVCCIAAILLAIGAAVTYHVIARSEGGLVASHPNDDGQNEFYRSSRTGFHFQPQRNWMNGELNPSSIRMDPSSVFSRPTSWLGRQLQLSRRPFM